MPDKVVSIAKVSRDSINSSIGWSISEKLKTPQVQNPVEKWIRTPEAFEGIINQDLFELAQKILEERQRRYDRAMSVLLNRSSQVLGSEPWG